MMYHDTIMIYINLSNAGFHTLSSGFLCFSNRYFEYTFQYMLFFLFKAFVRMLDMAIRKAIGFLLISVSLLLFLVFGLAAEISVQDDLDLTFWVLIIGLLVILILGNSFLVSKD
jgi:hypothetical protein